MADAVLLSGWREKLSWYDQYRYAPQNPMTNIMSDGDVVIRNRRQPGGCTLVRTESSSD